VLWALSSVGLRKKKKKKKKNIYIYADIYNTHSSVQFVVRKEHAWLIKELNSESGYVILIIFNFRK